MIKNEKCVSNNDQTYHRKCREEFSELVEQCYCNTPLMGLEPISPHDAATLSVDVRAQGKFNQRLCTTSLHSTDVPEKSTWGQLAQLTDTLTC